MILWVEQYHLQIVANDIRLLMSNENDGVNSAWHYLFMLLSNFLHISAKEMKYFQRIFFPNATFFLFVFQTLLPTSPVDFTVEKITASHEGSFLALSGNRGVAVLELPGRWGPNGQYKEGKERLLCWWVISILFSVCWCSKCMLATHDGVPEYKTRS